MKTKTIFLFTVLISFADISEAQWINRFNGQGDYTSSFNIVKTDNSGNVYLGGYAVNNNTFKDLLIVKLSALGDTVFTYRFDGTAHNADNILDMALDASKNIYVTGYSFGSSESGDLLTMKFDSSGNIVWQTTYNYSANEYEQGNSIAVDASGNVYVTGESDSDPSCMTNYDIVTIKYDVNGIQQWATRKNGLGNATDRPVKVAVDDAGNTYVAGRTNNGVNDDYITLKYNSTGVQQWEQTYDRLHNDFATDMAIDTSANAIYVTGRSNSGNDFDFVTVKYNFSGAQLWVQVYNDMVGDDRATCIALDGSGNIYVAGQSDIEASSAVNYNITTMKYSPSGAQQWVQTWNGSGNGDDIANALVVDISGNVFVAGQTDADPSGAVKDDYVLLKYNTSGAFQWARTYNGTGNSNDIPNSVALDNSGNPVITGTSIFAAPQFNAVTIKYDVAGASQWTKINHAVGDNSDNSHSIAADDSGNVYIAGYTLSFGTDRNYAFMKINSAGDTVWTRQLNGTATGSSDEAMALTLDGNGFVYITGYTRNSCQASDITTAKFNYRGDSIWVQYYNYPVTSGTDRAYSIDVDNSGNTYVTGKSDKDPTANYDYDIVTIKYNSTGTQQWVSRYASGGTGDDEANTVRVAASGNVYVGGKTFNGSDEDFIVIKYNSSGVQQWTSTYNSGNGDDALVSMVMDANENTYLTGYGTNSNGTSHDVITVKFNSSGARQWVRVYNAGANGDDEGRSIALDAIGNVIVAGSTDADTNAATLNDDYLLLKYDNNGIQQWVQTYDGTAHANDQANEVVTDVSGNIYVTGESDNGSASNQNYDFVTLKYSPSGNQLGIASYNGTANDSDIANTLTLKGNYLYVTGGSKGPNSQRDLVTIKYDIQVLSVTGPESHTDFSVYPNPAFGEAIIDFTSVSRLQNPSLSFTDIAGRVVGMILGIQSTHIKIDTRNFARGIYFITLSENKTPVKTIKLIIG